MCMIQTNKNGKITSYIKKPCAKLKKFSIPDLVVKDNYSQKILPVIPTIANLRIKGQSPIQSNINSQVIGEKKPQNHGLHGNE